MNEFKVIVIMNETMLELLKDKNKDYDVNLKIQKYLEDESIFFKIEKDFAYKLLVCVGIKESKLKEVYEKLTSKAFFFDLVYRGKIKKDDAKLIVKYSDNMF